MNNRLYIPSSESSTCLNGLITIFINNWSGSKTRQIFVEKLLDDDKPLFRVQTVISTIESDPIGLTTLPFMLLSEQENLSELIVSGIASVCRNIIKYSGNTEALKALGFRSNCLQAPSEVSVWTAFCELQMPQSVVHFLNTTRPGQLIEVPAALAHFEEHLKQPIRMHNVVKRWQQQQEPKSSTDRRAKDIQKLAPTLLAHDFAEGPDMTLADLLLYPSVKIIEEYLSSAGLNLCEYLPRVSHWISLMKPIVGTAWERTIEKPYAGDLSIQFRSLQIALPTLKMPRVAATSLYKKDPNRRGVGPLTTEDITGAVSALKNGRLWIGDTESLDLPSEFAVDVSDSAEFCPRVNWASLPDAAHPRQGQVPGDYKFYYFILFKMQPYSSN